MASLNVNVLNLLYTQFLTTEINREASLLKLLSKYARRDNQISWAVNTGGVNVSGQSITADAPAASQDNIISATLPMGTASLQSTFLINDREVEETAAQVSAPELKDLMKALLSSSVEEMVTKLGRLIYTGEGTVAHGGLMGLGVAVNDSDTPYYSGTGVIPYAGISATTYPVWKAVVHNKLASNEPAALSTNDFHKVQRLIRGKGGRYNIIVTSPGVLTAYKKLFETQRTFMLPAYGNTLYDMGFGQGEYNGVPIIDDAACPEFTSPSGKLYGSLYFLKLEDLSFYTVPTKMSETIENGVYTQLEPLSKTALYLQKYATGCIPQMQLRSRKNCAAVHGVLID